ncbi:hypothetical protein J2X52_000730 [Luteimonas sp. 3794]|nr:hypothetical protein [Luteimonas sp. 3794]
MPKRRSAATPARPRDLTRGAIGATLFAFALPILGGNVMQSLNGSVNAVWIGRFLGEGALAAIANANNILFLLLDAVFGVGMAATILVAQAIGRDDLPGAKRVIGTSATFFLTASVLVARAGHRTRRAINFNAYVDPRRLHGGCRPRAVSPSHSAGPAGVRARAPGDAGALAHARGPGGPEPVRGMCGMGAWAQGHLRR